MGKNGRMKLYEIKSENQWSEWNQLVRFTVTFGKVQLLQFEFDLDFEKSETSENFTQLYRSLLWFMIEPINLCFVEIPKQFNTILG